MDIYSSLVLGLVTGIMLMGFGTSTPTVSSAVNDCVVHPLPNEVLEHLMTVANASLQILQDNELKGQAEKPTTASVSSLRDSLNLGAPPDLLLLLLHVMEREQSELGRELSRLKDGLSMATKRPTEGDSMTISRHSTHTDDGVLGAIIDLQRDVRSLQKQQQQHGSVAMATEGDSISDWTREMATESTTCYPVDKWPHDCYDVAQKGKNESGVYTIYPHRCVRSRGSVRVWCDFDEEDDDVWTVVLSRQPLEEEEEEDEEDDQVNFNRGWTDYKNGFGDPQTEMWIGNEALHSLTSERPQILRVDMEDWDGNHRYAEYHTFLVEDEDAQYRLHIGQYTGNAGTGFDTHDNMRFTTSDRDNDAHATGNCAIDYHGGFWYNRCHAVSPTSLLLEKQKNTKGINWNSWYSDRTTLKEIRFKLKPKPCSRF